ncbi:hypothetical protein RHGRI_009976 [Rhododendron griersonianum]|uniref:Uncharacterized protein n=1 Tax=Rhododendron griersonianum TaxID=479676 RepID=A0AAV6KGT0_9ERIC|nr:hypothetical protein RHGRI_009976 [Rhododendron griersonianum]
MVHVLTKTIIDFKEISFQGLLSLQIKGVLVGMVQVILDGMALGGMVQLVMAFREILDALNLLASAFNIVMIFQAALVSSIGQGLGECSMLAVKSVGRTIISLILVAIVLTWDTDPLVNLAGLSLDNLLAFLICHKWGLHLVLLLRLSMPSLIPWDIMALALHLINLHMLST